MVSFTEGTVVAEHGRLGSTSAASRSRCVRSPRKCAAPQSRVYNKYIGGTMYKVVVHFRHNGKSKKRTVHARSVSEAYARIRAKFPGAWGIWAS